MNLTIYKIQVDFYILHKSASEMEKKIKSHCVFPRSGRMAKCVWPDVMGYKLLVYTRTSEAHTPEELSYQGLFKIGHLDIFHK